MPRLVFVDTSAFYALEDKHHAKEHALALSVSRQMKTDRVLLVTTDFVLDETYTMLRSGMGHKIAVLFGRVIQEGGIEIVPVDPFIQKEAWSIFEAYSDKDFSFTDCTSFAVMKRARIEIAFTFDRHFQQFGFTTLPHGIFRKGK